MLLELEFVEYGGTSCFLVVWGPGEGHIPVFWDQANGFEVLILRN